MLRRWLVGGAAALLLAAGISYGVSALDIPPAPQLDQPVVDQTKTLSDQQISELSDLINKGRQSKSYQLGILMITNLGDESLEEYSIKVARKWGIGEKDKSNGVLLLIAKNDRKLRIEVGNGLEGELTDLKTGHIIRDVITPKFKAGDYFGGIKNGVESIQAGVEGKADPHEKSTSENIWEAIAGSGVFLFWGVIWLASILGRSKSWWAGGIIGGAIGVIAVFLAGGVLWSFGLLIALILSGFGLDYFVSRNYREHVGKHGENASWWAGGGTWGGGSGGGRSGGSFGGGGFSGGGSSGSW